MRSLGLVCGRVGREERQKSIIVGIILIFEYYYLKCMVRMATLAEDIMVVGEQALEQEQRWSIPFQPRSWGG